MPLTGATAILRSNASVANNPEFPTPIAWLAATLALAGQQEDARVMLKHYLALLVPKAEPSPSGDPSRGPTIT
jgi:hypothetical protein